MTPIRELAESTVYYRYIPAAAARCCIRSHSRKAGGGQHFYIGAIAEQFHAQLVGVVNGQTDVNFIIARRHYLLRRM